MLREGVRRTGRSTHLGRHLLQSKVLILGQLQTYVWGKEGGIGSVSVKPEPSLSASQGFSESGEWVESGPGLAPSRAGVVAEKAL